MKLNSVEKIIVAVILLGLIIAGGGFLFVVPSFKSIESAQNVLADNRSEQAALMEQLSELDTIDEDIRLLKENAVDYEGGFYPDLTTYETSELAMKLLDSFNLDAHAISVTPLSTNDFTLETYVPIEVEYELKTNSQTAKNATDSAEGETAAAEDMVYTSVGGKFEDGGKIYNLNVNGINEISVTTEEGETIEPANYTEYMKKLYKSALCKFVESESISQKVGMVQATYTVKGKNSDYIKFIDFINTQEKASALASVEIPMTMEIKEEADSKTLYVTEAGTVTQGAEANGQMTIVGDNTEIEKTLTLIFYCVEPMNSLETIDANGSSVVVNQRPAVY